MIRFALALLGLSAGAGNAQTLVPVAPVVEICGQHAEVLAENEVCSVENHSAADTSEGTSTPDVPPVSITDIVVPARAVVQRGFVPSDANSGTIPIILTRHVQLPNSEPTQVKIIGQPFEKDALFSGTLDGSDPSAMFCP